MRRLLLLVLAAVSLGGPARALASAPAEPIEPAGSAAPTTTIDNSFLDTERNLTDCLNNSVELPGCGRAPTQEGDRGGALQLVAFAILTVAIAFIAWRVTRGIRSRDAALADGIRSAGRDDSAAPL